MNEQEVEASEKGADANTASNTPGTILKRTREAQGLTQQQVADRLHLRLSSVQAIESDGVEQGVSITFTKGYVRLYAKMLGLEYEPLLREFDKIHQRDQAPANLQSFSKRVAREANDSRWNLVTYVIVLLVIGSVVLWWIDYSNFDFSSSDNGMSQDNAQIDIPESSVSERDEGQSLLNNLSGNASGEVNGNLESNAAPAITEDQARRIDELNADAGQSIDGQEGDIINQAGRIVEDTEQALDDVNDDMNQLLEPPSSVIADNDSSNNTANSASALNDSANSDAEGSESRRNNFVPDPNAPYTINSDGTVNMVFTFEDDVWVSVKDADDETIAIGVKVKGRVMEVSGFPPIKVILGKPQFVSVNFGGQEIDMTQFPEGRSANFELPLE